MANPQTEDGYLRIANEIAEELARLHLSGNQWRLLWVVLRQSYGWNQKEARISMTQFCQKTGLDRRNAARELKSLIDRKIVVKNDNSFIATYRFQKDFSQWKPLSKKTPSVKIDNKTVVENDNDPKILPIIFKNKKDSVDFLSEISHLEKRYPDQGIILQAFQSITETRKSGRIADSVKVKILQSWSKYPVEQVLAGIQTYLSKGYAGQGKGEKYLAGIIKNTRPEPPKPEKIMPDWF